MEFQALTDRKLEISGGFVRRELREQDLLRRLEEYSGENSDCTVDCTLSLGFSSSASSESSEKIQQRGVDLKSDFWTKIDKKRCGHFQVGENYRVVNGYRWGNGGSNYMSLLPDIVNFGSKRDGFSFFGASSIAIADNSSICRNYMRVSNAPVNRILHKMGKNGTEITSTRKCSTCETTTTPLWRNGPKGTKSLCNACGIRFKKEERRAMGSSDSWIKRKRDGDEGREQERSKIPKI